jgi:hypothetical protein
MVTRQNDTETRQRAKEKPRPVEPSRSRTEMGEANELRGHKKGRKNEAGRWANWDGMEREGEK